MVKFYYLAHEIKQEEMSGSSSTHGRDEKREQNFCRKRPLGENESQGNRVLGLDRYF
jgi:hypothetical protein